MSLNHCVFFFPTVTMAFVSVRHLIAVPLSESTLTVKQKSKRNTVDIPEVSLGK